jgi:hypothetical protein
MALGFGAREVWVRPAVRAGVLRDAGALAGVPARVAAVFDAGAFAAALVAGFLAVPALGAADRFRGLDAGVDAAAPVRAAPFFGAGFDFLGAAFAAVRFGMFPPALKHAQRTPGRQAAGKYGPTAGSHQTTTDLPSGRAGKSPEWRGI